MQRRVIPCWHDGTNKVLVVGGKHGYNQTREERRNKLGSPAGA